MDLFVDFGEQEYWTIGHVQTTLSNSNNDGCGDSVVSGKSTYAGQAKMRLDSQACGCNAAVKPFLIPLGPHPAEHPVQSSQYTTTHTTRPSSGRKGRRYRALRASRGAQLSLSVLSPSPIQYFWFDRPQSWKLGAKYYITFVPFI